MLLVPRKRIWTQQPVGPLSIDWTHPLSAGLVDIIDFSGSVPRSVILGTPCTYFGSGQISGAPTQKGRALDTSANWGGVAFLRSDNAYTTPIQTHIALARHDTPKGQYAGMFTTAYDGGVNNSFSLQYYESTNIRANPGLLALPITNKIYGAGWKVIGATGKSRSTKVYVDGALVSSVDNIADSLLSGATSRLVLFGERTASLTYATKGLYGLHLMYNRDFSADEHKAIADNPWQIFRSPDSRIFVPVSAGGGSALAASASGSDNASGSANLAAQVALGAVGVSLASGSASASVTVPLSAAGITVAGGSANGTATVTISAAGLAQAAGQAGLSAEILLQAAGAAQAAGNAALSAQLSALASGAAQASGSANLSGGAPGALSAVGSATAGGAAALKVTVQLVATGGAQASGSATGTSGAPGAISAVGAAQAGGSGTASVAVALTAAGFVQAMGTGTFAVIVPLAAVGTAIASGRAVITASGLTVLSVARRIVATASYQRPTNIQTTSRPRNVQR